MLVNLQTKSSSCLNTELSNNDKDSQSTILWFWNSLIKSYQVRGICHKNVFHMLT